MNAAIYARYSSENQRETSLEDQERLCRQEADRLGYTVTKLYKDAGWSEAGGVTLARLAVNRESWRSR